MIYIAYLFMIIGAFFYALGGLGILRMPDLFNRAQAGTKATTLGTFSLLIGVGITNPAWLPKILIIIVFIAVTNPVGSSVLARAGYIMGVGVASETKIDEMKDLYKKERELNE
jgi:multicomponent Na+:H+ antiporter subunit G